MKVREAQITFKTVGKTQTVILQNARDIWDYMRHAYLAADYSVEHLYMIPVDSKSKVIGGCYKLSSGTLNETVAHCRDIFRHACQSNAYGFVLIHNHPSEDTTPSRADLDFTLKVRSAAKILDIQFLDHVIMGDLEEASSIYETKKPYYSFKEVGYI